MALRGFDFCCSPSVAELILAKTVGIYDVRFGRYVGIA